MPYCPYGMSMAKITPETVAERLERGDDDLRLVDVRDETDFREWHIPGSENVDVYDELKDDPDAAAEELADLPEHGEVVTICAAGYSQPTRQTCSRNRATTPKPW